MPENTESNPLHDMLPAAWQTPLAPFFADSATAAGLASFLAEEWRTQTVFPPRADILNALRLTPPEKVRVLILGQDPYHDEGQAHGLCFSVRRGVPPPPSLRNIFKELAADLGVPAPRHGELTAWAEQGVLLLNTVLTVRAHQAQSHAGRGWEAFTDTVIRAVSAKTEPVVFVLWGGPAQKKLPLIDRTRHAVVQAPHPSPLSAYRGFLGSRPFSTINGLLQANGFPVVDWCRGDDEPGLALGL